MKLHALQYYGGKSADGTGVGKWIKELLPSDLDVTYAEPYAGMLGVLLQRPAAINEIASDLNGRVVNWWMMVRDRTDEFHHIMEFTPYSESYFKECRETIDEGTPLERAIKFHVVVQMSQAHTDGQSGFSINYGAARRCSPPGIIAERVRRLADRLRYVQLLDRPALDILDRLSEVKRAVIYCDPPYRTADTTSYAVVRDHADLADVLWRQKGKVAISGYNDEWDDLDWQRHEFKTFFSSLGTTPEHKAVERVEVLWTNYDATMQGSFW